MNATALRSQHPQRSTPQMAPRELTTTPMKAVVATGYGAPTVLEVRKRPAPAPGPKEVLIAVRAASVTAADSMMRRGDPAYARLFLGLRKPKAEIPGSGLAGVVVAIGSDVDSFSVGDEVFGEAGLGFGAHAEFVAVAEDGVLLHKPAGMSFAEGASMCDGPLTSFNFLRRMAKIKPGQQVLVNGASGALGSAAVQIAKHVGAEVTGVCSTANLELVKSLGADRVVDYTQADFTEDLQRYDVIYDTIGVSSYRRSKRALTRAGVYLSPVLSLGLLLQMLWTLLGSKSAKFDATGLRRPPELREFLQELLAMRESGALRFVIERSYTMDQVAEAHERVDTGHKKGSLVLEMGSRAEAEHECEGE